MNGAKKVKAEHPNANNKELSLKLSEMWKSLSLHSKQTYYQAEKNLSEEFEMKCSNTYKQNQETQRRKIARRKTMDAPPQTASREDDDDIQIIEERTP
ncbi:hypothetical protein NQ317_012490 [Molorchus minor]|uniref:HMG box domain-containing protein n=1 Tax=Molorchus minor TaxID=1323400 RepID=A0ABQ9K4C6_9CUCU|nr:hypothetical protein NQ317_012490 [Molorchus minor]